MTVEELAEWSPWVPIDEAGISATVTPGVYVARQGAEGPVVYVGMAGERRGKGVRGRLRVYARGIAIHSGLGQAAFDRALADPAFLNARLAEVEDGQPRRAREWGRLAIERADLYVRWASCATRQEALALEVQVIEAQDLVTLWNRS